MGTVRQRRKNRSGTKRVRQKPKSTKLRFGDKSIADHWDKKKTFSQNFRDLGLVAKLKNATGGVQRDSSTAVWEERQKTAPNKLKITTNPVQELEIEEAEIERDETGKIIRVVETGSSRRSNPLKDPLNELSDSEVLDMQKSVPSSKAAKHDLVHQLENRAQDEVRQSKKRPSDREVEWLETLAKKHGDDYKAMQWDKRGNPMQQSAGDIKRRMKQWRQWQAEHSEYAHSAAD